MIETDVFVFFEMVRSEGERYCKYAGNYRNAMGRPLRHFGKEGYIC